ncbi:MAG: bifunctional riboflavin kinase/FMN adenylyltransferase, partial [Porticoccaceae bacterium]|nr:bifunctional riboflavin kinase/FMN adenylyltransferase [Porticoccaceae bacterium]
LHKIRDEEKFTTVEKLVETITADINSIRQWFLHNEK